MTPTSSTLSAVGGSSAAVVCGSALETKRGSRAGVSLDAGVGSTAGSGTDTANRGAHRAADKGTQPGTARSQGTSNANPPVGLVSAVGVVILLLSMTSGAGLRLWRSVGV